MPLVVGTMPLVVGWQQARGKCWPWSEGNSLLGNQVRECQDGVSALSCA